MPRVAALQDAPVFLDRRATLERLLEWVERATDEGVELLACGETYLPGYPFWLSHTGAAAFDEPTQKEAYRRYLEAAVRLDGPEIRELEVVSRSSRIALVVGIAERGPGPASGSVFCSAVTIDPDRGVLAAHRKLMPTYEERLVWAPGDGHGLRVHTLCGLRVGVLNCWENWMPQARHALYGDGEELRVALWPGAVRNTVDITRFIALEGRVFVLSAGGLLAVDDVPDDFPLRDRLPVDRTWYHNGGSCVAAPDGRWLVEPVAQTKGLIVADIDPRLVSRERQNFDCTGHYSRPDVFDVRVDRRRRQSVTFLDEDALPE
ncbi:MAG: carbon-nitrogen hydrolase family protein [Myxococcales bacterium FL481]|nr:MAG: carbon-nitrogen hydrolase family protein [Myxococcales bacterium FL481]